MTDQSYIVTWFGTFAIFYISNKNSNKSPLIAKMLDFPKHLGQLSWTVAWAIFPFLQDVIASIPSIIEHSNQVFFEDILDQTI